MSAQGALRVLRWTYSAFIAASSAVTIVNSWHGHGEDTHPHGAFFVSVLASVEFAAAIALMFEPMELLSAAVLFLVFVIASVASAASLELPAILRFVFYAVTLFYIVFAHRQLVTKGAP